MATPASLPLRVSIADDHQMFVEAMRLILDGSPSVEVVSISNNGSDLLRDVREYRPDIALVDISMDGPGFLSIATEIGRMKRPTRLVALTMHLDRDLADRVIDAGFGGYVVKDAAVAELMEAIGAAAEGRVFVSQSVLAIKPSAVELGINLTQREFACLQGAAEGRANRDIANELGISERTVKFHFENIFRKLDVKSRGQAVAVARRTRLLQGPP